MFFVTQSKGYEDTTEVYWIGPSQQEAESQAHARADAEDADNASDWHVWEYVEPSPGEEPNHRHILTARKYVDPMQGIIEHEARGKVRGPWSVEIADDGTKPSGYYVGMDALFCRGGTQHHTRKLVAYDENTGMYQTHTTMPGWLTVTDWDLFIHEDTNNKDTL